MKYPFILAFDPATHNFGYAVVRINRDKMEWKLDKCGLLKNTIKDLNINLDRQIMNFKNEIRFLTAQYKPDLMVVERFMNRYVTSSAMNEKVNVMIGILLAKPGIPNLQIVSAGAWKKQAASFVDIKDEYNQGRKYIREYCKETNKDREISKALQNQVSHCIDATLIALIYGSKYLQIEKQQLLNKVWHVITERIIKEHEMSGVEN